MARPLLPLGNKAPWVLLGLGAFLAVAGFWTGNTQMVIVGAVVVAFWAVAFPLSRFLLGNDEEPPDRP
ncbi:MAG: hypothetical protein AB7N24_08875 [Dehalococcoidia bacterium]